MVKRVVRNLLGDFRLQHLTPDTRDVLRMQACTIRKKHFLRQLYAEWFHSIRRMIPVDVSGSVLELGSGGGFLHEILPGVIRSDILDVGNSDILLDGLRLPMQSRVLKAIVMVDVFHHLPEVDLFFGEAARCIRTGGVVVMIEPWHTRWSRLIYRWLHPEPFEPGAKDWGFPAGHPLSRSNQALPWIVFERDREVFRRRYPQWSLRGLTLHTPFRYLVSGGVAYRALMPGAAFKHWRRIENAFNPWMNSWAMFATITLKREKNR